MDFGKPYRLEVVGGSPALHSASLSVTSTGLFVATPSMNISEDKAPFLITQGHDAQTLVAYSENKSMGLPESYCTLQGPSGKGIFQLYQSTCKEPEGSGSEIIFDGWEVLSDGWKVVSEGGALFLRNDHFAERGHWIAELMETADGKEEWVPWWLSPNAANMEDFKHYVMIDIELIESS